MGSDHVKPVKNVMESKERRYCFTKPRSHEFSYWVDISGNGSSGMVEGRLMEWIGWMDG